MIPIVEVKINREIRDYTESMFFGLSLRQFVFSLLAILVAVGVYFMLKPHLGTETVSWVCILGAVPFAAMGFIKYNGMTAERFVWAWLRSEFIVPKKLMFRATNIYAEALKSILESPRNQPCGESKDGKSGAFLRLRGNARYTGRNGTEGGNPL